MGNRPPGERSLVFSTSVSPRDQRTLCRDSRCSRSNALMCLRLSRHPIERPPCFNELTEDLVFPSSVRGPVDLLQGCHCRINSACRCRSSGVQCRAMLYPLG